MNDRNEKILDISVIIPVRNGEGTIIACLDSLASQVHRPQEIIVVDNGSTDQTVSFVKQWILSHPDLSSRFVTEIKRGPSAARNRGGRIAKGRILAFLDADCIAPSGWLQRISDEIHQGAGVVGGPYQGAALIAAVEKYATLGWFFRSMNQYSLRSPFVSHFLLGGNMALLRRNWEKVRGFDEALHAGEDLDLSFRLKKEGVSVKYIPSLRVVHQITSSFFKRVKRAFSHGMLQSKIAKRDFQRLFIISTFERTWEFPFLWTIAVESISLTKILCGIGILGWTRSSLAVVLFILLALLWEYKMVYQFLRLGIPLTFLDYFSIPFGWAFSRMAMELGRLVGCVRYKVFCW